MPAHVCTATSQRSFLLQYTRLAILTAQSYLNPHPAMQWCPCGYCCIPLGSFSYWRPLQGKGTSVSWLQVSPCPPVCHLWGSRSPCPSAYSGDPQLRLMGTSGHRMCGMSLLSIRAKWVFQFPLPWNEMTWQP